MKRLLTGARNLTVYHAALFAVAGMISLFGGLQLVRSQDPPPETQTKEGKTRPVLIVPGNTVDAGLVIFQPDSDHDGMPDEDEARNGTDPNNAADADGDADGDGATNGDEVAGGSDVNNPDSDGDGASDGEEISLGYNPTDPNSTPPPTSALVSLLVQPNPINLSINFVLGQQPVQLRVTGVRANGAKFDLTGSPTLSFQSLDENVALVDGSGTVAGSNAGTTIIRVMRDAVTADVPVNVTIVSPGILSELSIPGFANNVDVAQDYAYVAAGSAGLVIVNVSDKSNPVIVGALDTPGNANDVRVVGTTAYVADGFSGLQIIDVSNPASPALLGSLETIGESNDVVIRGTRAYLADGSGGMLIIDVSNPAAPTTIGGVDPPGVARGVDVSGDLVAVANSQSVLIIDAAVPAAPVVVGSVLVSANVLDLEVRNRFAYVATEGQGLLLIDFSVPTAPRVAAGSGGFSLKDVALGDRYAVAPEFVFADYVPIFDLGDPGNLVFTAALNLSFTGAFRGTGVALTDQHIYMTGTTQAGSILNGTTGTTRLFILEYQGPANDVTDTGGVAPTVTIDSPQSGQSATEGDPVTVSISATDDVEVTSVQLIVNGVVVIEDGVAPYNITCYVPRGGSTAVIEAKAFDAAGNSTTSPPVTINVLPDPPPVATIIVPEEGQLLYQQQDIFIAADASDNRTVTKIVFTVNGSPVNNFSFYRVPYGVSSLTFAATATDDFGQTGSISRTVNVVPDPPPTLTIIAPPEGTQFIEGQVVEFIADASDNFFVDHVDFTINGEVFSDSQTPYRQTYTIPVGVTSVLLEVAAVDNIGQRTEDSRTFTVVPDLGTTVTGLVFDNSAQPVEGATVTVGQLTTQTGADGRFNIPDIATAQGDILVRVSATLSGQPAANASLPTAGVSGGTTDVGVITLSIAPTAPTAFLLGDYNTNFLPDVFVGYADRQSLIYTFDGSQFTQSSSALLPYGAVSSAVGLDLNFGSQPQIFAQLTGRQGSVTEVTFDNGTMLPPSTIATGLGGESDYTAAGLDTQQATSDIVSRPEQSSKKPGNALASSSNRAVLAFLKTSSGATSLTVRFGVAAQTYSDPVFLPVDSSTPLRTLTVADVNNDGLVDVIAVKPDAGSGAKLVVYLRTSDTSFGNAIESPITIRTAAPAGVVVDFVLGSLAGNSSKDIAVLGDDRVRVYQGDGSGAFVSVRDVTIPSGRIVTGLTAADVSNDGRADIIVTTRDATTPTAKDARVFLNSSSGVFLSPTINSYVGPISTGDTRMGVGNWGGDHRRIDLVVADGNAVLVIFDVGPARSGS